MFSKTAQIALVATALTLGACAKPPQQEIDGSKAALTAADKAQASRYAADEWAAAQEAQQAVDAEIEAQAGKLGLFRSYDHTKELITEANAKAEAARAAAVANKETARQEAQAKVDAAHASLTAAQNLVTELQACPRKPKGFEADMEVMTGNLTGLEGSVAGLDQAMTGEEYDTAGTEAENLRQQLDVLVADMQSAKEKIGCK
ncbi:MAG: hypothetical protein KDD11_01740 [Acidobacteria bacterium]|nr:hypothetical protein [Acidobacteriota bacterium]